MTEGRKATEILLSIESLCQNILGYVQNSDANYKLLLREMRKQTPETKVIATAPQSQTQAQQQPQATPKQQASAQFYSSPDLKAKLQAALAVAKIESSDEDVKFPEAKPITKPIPVSQKIIYADQTNLYMATIEIQSLSGELVKQGKTNNSGKWIMPLHPGDYVVKVTKAGTAKRNPIDTEYGITVPNQSSAVELEGKIL